MTIYKPKKAEKKDNTGVPVPEVVTEPLVSTENEKNSKAAAALLPPPQSPTLIITTRRRRGNCANICVCLTAVAVLITGIMGGIYLYKHLTHRTFQAWCSVKYYEEDPTMQQQYGEQRRYRGNFEERIEIDKEYGRFERIEVPDVDECQRAVIVHDFEKNLTAIIDQTKGHCFIKPLNRSTVRPPHDFWDLLIKIKTGYYLPDAEVVRDRYQVMEPPVQNLQPYGYYIWRECRRYDTYELKRIPANEPIAMVKRDICAAQTQLFFEGSSGGSILMKDELLFPCDSVHFTDQ